LNEYSNSLAASRDVERFGRRKRQERLSQSPFCSDGRDESSHRGVIALLRAQFEF
jgi:hypothetical protein